MKVKDFFSFFETPGHGHRVNSQDFTHLRKPVAHLVNRQVGNEGPGATYLFLPPSQEEIFEVHLKPLGYLSYQLGEGDMALPGNHYLC